ncbi:MAG: hypothetical protein ACMG50_07680, partial [Thermomonas sp.]
PVSKDTTGIGPAIDRRRAPRIGTDEVVARVIDAMPPFDVRYPSGNPRRPALQFSFMGFGLLSASDARPASTFLKLLVEVQVVLPTIALCLLTLFCRKRLLGET